MRVYALVVVGLNAGHVGCSAPSAVPPDVAPRTPPSPAQHEATIDGRPADPPSASEFSSRPSTGCEDAPAPPVAEDRDQLERTVPQRNRKFGAVTCRGGDEVWFDAAKHMRVCTTAKAVTVHGISIPAGAYTHFYPDGRPEQTDLARPQTLKTADGRAVRCAADHVSLSEAGALLYCDLVGAMSIGEAHLRAGKGVAFHDGGELASGTIDRPYALPFATFPAGSRLSWRADGSVSGGRLPEAMTVAGFPVRSAFTVYPDGQLKTLTLAEDTSIQGHDFAALTDLLLRPDGSLQSAAIIDYDTMPHGELITLTTHVHYDCAGAVSSEYVDRHVADEAPPKFR